MSLSTWRAWSARRCTMSSIPVIASAARREPWAWKIWPQACTSSSWIAARVRASPSRRAPAPPDKLHCTARPRTLLGRELEQNSQKMPTEPTKLPRKVLQAGKCTSASSVVQDGVIEQLVFPDLCWLLLLLVSCFGQGGWGTRDTTRGVAARFSRAV